VLALVDRGWSTDGIARFLGIAPRTINAHAHSASRSLQASHRSAAARVLTEDEAGAQSGPPVVLVEGEARLAQVIDLLAAVGWTPVDGWELNGSRDLGHGVIRSEADSQSAILAALQGHALAIAVDHTPLSTGLVVNLRRVALTHDWRTEPPAVLDLGPDTIRLAVAVGGEGIGVEAAAERLGMSRRTAYRRLATAAATLHAHGPVDAAQRIRRVVSPLICAAKVRAGGGTRAS
jgi:hypothetical protein